MICVQEIVYSTNLKVQTPSEYTLLQLCLESSDACFFFVPFVHLDNYDFGHRSIFVVTVKLEKRYFIQEQASCSYLKFKVAIDFIYK